MRSNLTNFRRYVNGKQARHGVGAMPKTAKIAPAILPFFLPFLMLHLLYEKTNGERGETGEKRAVTFVTAPALNLYMCIFHEHALIF